MQRRLKTTKTRKYFQIDWYSASSRTIVLHRIQYLIIYVDLCWVRVARLPCVAFDSNRYEIINTDRNWIGMASENKNRSFFFLSFFLFRSFRLSWQWRVATDMPFNSSKPINPIKFGLFVKYTMLWTLNHISISLASCFLLNVSFSFSQSHTFGHVYSVQP